MVEKVEATKKIKKVKKVKKCLLVIIILFLAIVLFIPTICYGEPTTNESAKKDLEDKINEQLENLDTKEIDEILKNLTENQKKIFGNSDFKTKIKELISGNMETNYDNFFEYLTSILFENIRYLVPLFAGIIAISIISGLLTAVKPSFISEGISNLIYLVCFCSIILLILSSIFGIIKDTEESIKSINEQMTAIMPIILTMMAANGGNASVAVYKPAVAFLSQGIVQIITIVVFPLIVAIIIFSVIGHMSDSIKLNKFIDFFKSICKWVIGISLTIFTLFLSVQGITSASFDGISFRAAKYALGNSVPIVGGFLKDGMDIILAGSVLIKNATGSGSLLLILSMILFPLIEIITFSLLLKLTAAITESIADSKISSFLSSISGGINYLLAVLLGIGFMYFITILLLICSSNSFF